MSRCQLVKEKSASECVKWCVCKKIDGGGEREMDGINRGCILDATSWHDLKFSYHLGQIPKCLLKDKCILSP